MCDGEKLGSRALRREREPGAKTIVGECAPAAGAVEGEESLLRKNPGDEGKQQVGVAVDDFFPTSGLGGFRTPNS